MTTRKPLLSDVPGAISRGPVVVVLLVVALVLAGCSSAPVSEPSTSSELLSVAEFEEELKNGARFVLNVHTPDEGSIEGTSAAVPFDQLEQRVSELPDDRGTPLAVYCRTDRMSAIAVSTLIDLGYQDVVELDGGMVAWADSGRTLLPPETDPD